MNQHNGQPSIHRNGAGPNGSEAWPSQINFMTPTWGQDGHPRQPVKHMAKRTPRRRPGSMANSHRQLPNVTYPSVSSSTKAPAGNFVNSNHQAAQTNGYTRNGNPVYLPPPRQVAQPSRSLLQNQYAWPTQVRQDGRSSPQLLEQHRSIESPRTRHNASLPPQLSTNRFADNVYEFRNSAPILEQSHTNGRRPFDWDWQPSLPGLARTLSQSGPNGISMPLERTAHEPPKYVAKRPANLILDDRIPTPPVEQGNRGYAWPSKSISSENQQAKRNSESHGRPYLDVRAAASPMCQIYDQETNYQSSFIASSGISKVPNHKVLPSSISASSSSHLSQTSRQTEAKDFRHPVPHEISRAPLPVLKSPTVISNGKSPIISSGKSSVARQPSVRKVAEPVAPSPVKVNGIRKFDSLKFDSLIYGQPGAARPPSGVAVPSRTKRSRSLSRDQSEPESKMYIHANPAIHKAHNRSDEWFTEKAREIIARGNRKFWFGKVYERQRWLRRRQASPTREIQLSNDGHHPPRRQEPQLHGHRRALDFSDVPESELPDYVQENPDWQKACEWFRQNQTVRDLRVRETKRCEAETNNYYRSIRGSKMPTFGSRR